MQFWLMKSEPDVYSWFDLCRDGFGVWDGVRNYQARNNLQAMKLGDKAFFYHSNTGLEIVGVMEITKEAFQDPTTEDARWYAVEVKPLEQLEKPVSLQKLKSDETMQGLLLLRHTRLSVMPIDEQMFYRILSMSKI
jgi:predicted RNA-binding protein with PUA-like domain